MAYRSGPSHEAQPEDVFVPAGAYVPPHARNQQQNINTPFPNPHVYPYNHAYLALVTSENMSGPDSMSPNRPLPSTPKGRPDADGIAVTGAIYNHITDTIDLAEYSRIHDRLKSKSGTVENEKIVRPEDFSNAQESASGPAAPEATKKKKKKKPKKKNVANDPKHSITHNPASEVSASPTVDIDSNNQGNQVPGAEVEFEKTSIEAKKLNDKDVVDEPMSDKQVHDKQVHDKQVHDKQVHDKHAGFSVVPDVATVTHGPSIDAINDVAKDKITTGVEQDVKADVRAETEQTRSKAAAAGNKADKVTTAKIKASVSSSKTSGGKRDSEKKKSTLNHGKIKKDGTAKADHIAVPNAETDGQDKKSQDKKAADKRDSVESTRTPGILLLETKDGVLSTNGDAARNNPAKADEEFILASRLSRTAPLDTKIEVQLETSGISSTEGVQVDPESTATIPVNNKDNNKGKCKAKKVVPAIPDILKNRQRSTQKNTVESEQAKSFTTVTRGKRTGKPTSLLRDFESWKEHNVKQATSKPGTQTNRDAIITDPHDTTEHFATDSNDTTKVIVPESSSQPKQSASHRRNAQKRSSKPNGQHDESEFLASSSLGGNAQDFPKSTTFKQSAPTQDKVAPGNSEKRRKKKKGKGPAARGDINSTTTAENIDWSAIGNRRRASSVHSKSSISTTPVINKAEDKKMVMIDRSEGMSTFHPKTATPTDVVVGYTDGQTRVRNDQKTAKKPQSAFESFLHVIGTGGNTKVDSSTDRATTVGEVDKEGCPSNDSAEETGHETLSTAVVAQTFQEADTAVEVADIDPKQANRSLRDDESATTTMEDEHRNNAALLAELAATETSNDAAVVAEIDSKQADPNSKAARPAETGGLITQSDELTEDITVAQESAVVMDTTPIQDGARPIMSGNADASNLIAQDNAIVTDSTTTMDHQAPINGDTGADNSAHHLRESNNSPVVGGAELGPVEFAAAEASESGTKLTSSFATIQEDVQAMERAPISTLENPLFAPSGALIRPGFSEADLTEVEKVALRTWEEATGRAPKRPVPWTAEDKLVYDETPSTRGPSWLPKHERGSYFYD